MPADLDHLLSEAAAPPVDPIDTDALWSAGRRRRLVRRLTAVSGGLASLGVLAVAVSTLGLGGLGTPEVSPLGETDDADEAPETDPVEEPTPPAIDPEAEDVESPEVTDEESTETTDEDAETSEEVEPEVETSQDPGPTPDAAAVADPCATHDANEMVAFVDVVAPVAGQSVDDVIELVGCSSVYEGTVRYRLLDGGTVLVDSFTTATAGGPELGEFRASIPVEATGTLTLEVFWDSPADGSEQGLVTIAVEAS